MVQLEQVPDQTAVWAVGLAVAVFIGLSPATTG
jgi:hypothetical protein